MLKYFLILFLLFPGQHLAAQQEETQTQAEKTVDSILNEFKNSTEPNSELDPANDQEKLVAAEEKYMDEFLKVERDKQEVKKFKLYLQIFLGVVFLFLFIMAIRNAKRRKERGVETSSGQNKVTGGF